MRYHYTPSRMAKIFKKCNTKGRREYGTKCSSFLCWCESNMLSVVSTFSPSNDPAIPLLYVYPRKLKLLITLKLRHNIGRSIWCYRRFLFNSSVQNCLMGTCQKWNSPSAGEWL